MYQYKSKLLGVESVLVFMFSYIFHEKQIKKFKKDLLHIYAFLYNDLFFKGYVKNLKWLH